MTYEPRSATGAGPRPDGDDADPRDELTPLHVLVAAPPVVGAAVPDAVELGSDVEPGTAVEEVVHGIDPTDVVAAPRHRRQPWPLLIVSVLLALSLGLATYLLLTTRAHEARAGEWESAARETGGDLAQARTELATTTSELHATQEQLLTAQGRITALADEKARIGDDRETQRQLADYQQRISALAGKVATALTTCIDGQYTLIGYLADPSLYDQTDLARFRTDVQEVCGAATEANSRLQRELMP